MRYFINNKNIRRNVIKIKFQYWKRAGSKLDFEFRKKHSFYIEFVQIKNDFLIILIKIYCIFDGYTNFSQR